MAYIRNVIGWIRILLIWLMLCMWVKWQKQDKNSLWATLMLRVCDGECLWCSYVNEIHDVHQRHLPSVLCAALCPQGDKLNKNSYAGYGCYVIGWIEYGFCWLDWCSSVKWQKQDKNSLWGNSHASSLWWWMPLMLLRERDSRCALEAFIICAMCSTLPTGR